MEKKQTHISYGFISGLGVAALSAIIYFSGVAFKPGMQYISYVPFLVGMILNGMAYSKANDGFVTFGNVFGSCFKASMITTIIILLWSVGAMYMLPDMKTKAMAMAREQMAKNPQMTEEMIDKAMDITQKYWNTFLIAGAILGSMIYGAIFSLIGAAIAKKRGPRPEVGSF